MIKRRLNHFKLTDNVRNTEAKRRLGEDFMYPKGTLVSFPGDNIITAAEIYVNGQCVCMDHAQRKILSAHLGLTRTSLDTILVDYAPMNGKELLKQLIESEFVSMGAVETAAQMLTERKKTEFHI